MRTRYRFGRLVFGLTLVMTDVDGPPVPKAELAEQVVGGGADRVQHAAAEVLEAHRLGGEPDPIQQPVLVQVPAGRGPVGVGILERGGADARERPILVVVVQGIWCARCTVHEVQVREAVVVVVDPGETGAERLDHEFVG